MLKPTVLYPTLVKGYMEAEAVRFESIDGSEMYIAPQDLMSQFALLFYPRDNGIWFQNFKPFELGGKTWFVTHVQKKATYFSLQYDPWIYHWGKFWKLQEPGKPGSEKGIYWRTWGWRWQVPDDNSKGTPWIWSGGRFPGMHLD